MLFIKTKNDERKTIARPFLTQQVETPTLRKGLYKWFGCKKKMSLSRSETGEPHPAYVVLITNYSLQTYYNIVSVNIHSLIFVH